MTLGSAEGSHCASREGSNASSADNNSVSPLAALVASTLDSERKARRDRIEGTEKARRLRSFTDNILDDKHFPVREILCAT